MGVKMNQLSYLSILKVFQKVRGSQATPKFGGIQCMLFTLGLLFPQINDKTLFSNFNKSEGNIATGKVLNTFKSLGKILISIAYNLPSQEGGDVSHRSKSVISCL